MSAPGLVGPGSCYAFDDDMGGITLGSIENIPPGTSLTQEMEAETEEVVVNP